MTMSSGVSIEARASRTGQRILCGHQAGHGHGQRVHPASQTTKLRSPSLTQTEGAAPGWELSPLAAHRSWAPLVLSIHRSTDGFYLNHSPPEIFLSFCLRTCFLVMLLRNKVETIPFQFRKASKCTQGRVSVKRAQHTYLDHILVKNTLFSCNKSWEIQSLDTVFQYFPT